MWTGIAIGMGLGVTLHNLLAGIAMGLGLGIAFSRATVKTGEE